MMKIGLIGVPGSGKSDLAEALAAHYGLDVVDGYAEWVTKHHGWVLGQFATYAGNLAVGLERHARENRLQESFVTCGTMIETATYQAVNRYLDQQEFDPRRSGGPLVTLGVMIEDMFTYDFLFYLPAQIEKLTSYTAKLEQGLEEAIKTFEVPAVRLEFTEGGVAQAAIEVIDREKRRLDAASAPE